MSRFILAQLCAVLLAACLLTACDSTPEPPQPKAPAAAQQQQVPAMKTADRLQNMRLLQAILADYRKNHTYMDGDVYDCDNMAKDVWNILRTKGFRAKLAGGNAEKDVMKTTETYLMGASHAWVMAELAPNDWMALECTGGFLVPREKNPLYYTSAIFFSDPTEMEEFLGTMKRAKETCTEYGTLSRGWNKAFAGKTAKPGSTTDRSVMQAKGYMDAKKRECDDCVTKLQVAIMTKRKL